MPDKADAQLCFLDNSRLDAPLVEPLNVCTHEGTRIGRLEGVVIDPDEQRARYFVVDRGRFRPNRCLVPLPGHLDLAHQAICLEAGDDEAADWRPFRPADFGRLGYDGETIPALR